LIFRKKYLPIASAIAFTLMTQPNQIFADTLNFPGGIQPAEMIVGKENCRGFMVAVAVLVVLLTLLLFFAWSRKRDNPTPEPPLHTATLGIKNSDVA